MRNTERSPEVCSRPTGKANNGSERNISLKEPTKTNRKGLCKVASLEEIKEQDYSLTQAYVGIALKIWYGFFDYKAEWQKYITSSHNSYRSHSLMQKQIQSVKLWGKVWKQVSLNKFVWFQKRFWFTKAKFGRRCYSVYGSTSIFGLP